MQNFETREQVREFLSDKLASLERAYIKDGLTSRETMAKFGLGHWYDAEKAYFARFFNYYLPKGLPHGGARKGSGNKPGVQFCGNCRQLLENCKGLKGC